METGLWLDSWEYFFYPFRDKSAEKSTRMVDYDSFHYRDGDEV